MTKKKTITDADVRFDLTGQRKVVGMKTSDARWAAQMAALAERMDVLVDNLPGGSAEYETATLRHIPPNLLEDLRVTHAEFPFLRPVIEGALRKLGIEIGNAAKLALAELGWTYNGVDGSGPFTGIRAASDDTTKGKA